MTYNKTMWENRVPPRINGTNLNKIEQGIYDAHMMATGRCATFVVAANGSSDVSKRHADYVCDGVADDVQIQAAIDALPSGGGKILLMEGGFYLNSTIELNVDNLMFFGNNGTIIYPSTAGDKIIYVLADNLEIANIEFNSTNLTSGVGTGAIYSKYDCDANILVENLWIHHCRFIGKYHNGGDYPTDLYDGTFRKVIEPGWVKNTVISDNYFYHYSFEAVSIGSLLQRSFCGQLDKYCESVIVKNNFMRGGYGGVVFEARTKHSIAESNIIWTKIGTNIGYGVYTIHADTKFNIIRNNIILQTQQHGIYDTGRYNLHDGNIILAVDNGNGITQGIDSNAVNNYIQSIPNGRGIVGGGMASNNTIIDAGTGIEETKHIEGNIIINCYSHGISLTSDDAQVIDNRIISCGKAESAIWVRQSSPPSDWTIVRGNRISDPYAGISTTLDGDFASGLTVITVSDVSNIRPGQLIETNPSGYSVEDNEVKDINYDTKELTLWSALTNDHTSGDALTGRQMIPWSHGIRGYDQADQIIIEDNFVQGLPHPLSTVGANSIVKNNKGWLTETSSTATIASGNTYVEITHGLAITPLAKDISITQTNDLGSASTTGCWISDIGASTFRINVGSDPGVGGAEFSWNIGSY